MKAKNWVVKIAKTPQFWACIAVFVIGIALLHASKRSVRRLGDLIEEVDRRGNPRFNKPSKKSSSSAKTNRATSIREERCREIFELIFEGYKFPSVRPDFLKNVTKYNLELDGYCEDIKTPIGYGLAFEFDGRQHTEFTPRFHKSIEDFEYQVLKDKLKTALCKENNIVLIRVPKYVVYKDLEKFILESLKENKIKY